MLTRIDKKYRKQYVRFFRLTLVSSDLAWCQVICFIIEPGLNTYSKAVSALINFPGNKLPFAKESTGVIKIFSNYFSLNLFYKHLAPLGKSTNPCNQQVTQVYYYFINFHSYYFSSSSSLLLLIYFLRGILRKTRWRPYKIKLYIHHNKSPLRAFWF